MAGRPDIPGGIRMSSAQVDVLLRRVGALPMLPGTLARLVELADVGLRTTAGRDRLSELLCSDPALGIALLRRADGARGVVSCAHAIGRLGVQAAAAEALAAPVLPCRADGAEPLRSRLAELIVHCQAVGCAAELLAEAHPLGVSGDEAFTAGLLHDVGKLAMLSTLPKTYERVIEGVRSGQGNIADAERRRIGADHTVLARRLGEHWALPAGVAEVAWLHHQPLEAIPTDVRRPERIALVGLADALVRRRRLGYSGNFEFPRTPAQLAEPLGISKELLEDVAARLPERLAAAGEAIGLDRQLTTAEFCDALQGAKRRLGQIASDLRDRCTAARPGAEAFSSLREFCARLSPEAGVSDVLQGIVDTFAAELRPDEPVVGYSIGAEVGEVLVLRRDPAGTAWESFPCAGEEVPETPDLGRLLSDPGDLARWAGTSLEAHQPLCCQGRWVGGVLGRFADPDAAPRREALAAAVALALAITQGRARAMRVSEQLAGASHVLAQTQQALAETKTLAAVAEMAAGAAHELNNPLAVVSGRAQLMRERAETPEDRETWDLIARQAHRISDIITELMEFASPAPPEPAPVDAAALLEEARNRFVERNAAQADGSMIDIESGDALPAVWVDRSQALHVLSELLTNAVRAAGPSRRVTLRAE